MPSPARARSSSRSIRGAFPTRRCAARSATRSGLSSAPRPPRRHEIPVLYGVETGADLAELAAHAGMSPEELCRRHAEGEYAVAFLGFAPGWAYLSGLDPALHAPRLPTPRPRVPAGSVAIGGPYTGVYPSATPGGWRLIGRAAVRLFDEEAEPPALFAPGDLVRFAAVAPGRFAAMEAEIAAASSRVATSPGGRPAFRVVKSGVFASVQGAPRPGGGGSGLPPGGAMDEGALAQGNALLGNPPDAAAVEMTLLGPELEALSSFFVCVSGAAMALERNGVTASASDAAAGRGGRSPPLRAVARRDARVPLRRGRAPRAGAARADETPRARRDPDGSAGRGARRPRGRPRSGVRESRPRRAAPSSRCASSSTRAASASSSAARSRRSCRNRSASPRRATAAESGWRDRPSRRPARPKCRRRERPAARSRCRSTGSRSSSGPTGPSPGATRASAPSLRRTGRSRRRRRRGARCASRR